eukprot:TRINITY_DN38430_c0_g1_i1.p1 TRINITY_DN38430_c0_g1~~TRINITY_DN38430_c0_g1_i1.p1  ORF type:complete len:461 (+),score=92.85 TRINITY_DN38430_c0_g1_i1:48-1385(+)
MAATAMPAAKPLMQCAVLPLHRSCASTPPRDHQRRAPAAAAALAVAASVWRARLLPRAWEVARSGRTLRHRHHRRLCQVRTACAALRRPQSRGQTSGSATAVTSELPPAEQPWDNALPGEDRPGSAWELGSRVFRRELQELFSALRGTCLQGLSEKLQLATGLQELQPRQQLPAFLDMLQLDADKVAERERERGVPESFPLVKAIFFVLCWSLDRLYEGRPIQKFWVLETVARLPYFSYISVLHLYESLGWWRTPEIRHIHCAEEDNELHHLLIMEALGGDGAWFDRFAAQHAAIVYYWVVTALFVVNPELAYNFSLLVEEHAYVTYAEFVDANAELLRRVPPPPIATEYYLSGDLYYFDKFQTSRLASDFEVRRPPCRHLLDVFCNIRDDEFEHIQTMKACQDWWARRGPPPVPPNERFAGARRQAWLKWSEQVNALFAQDEHA